MGGRPRRSRSRAFALCAAALLWAASFAPVVRAGAAINCTYTASDHRVKITITGEHNVDLDRSGSGTLLVNDVPCPRSPTVNNTDRIAIFSGAGHQVVTIFLGNGGFKPGFTNEAGTSDEIEISVSLGGDHDALAIMGGSAGDHVVFGKSSGTFVQGRANLNAGETTGVDADLTFILGAEDIFFFGLDGTDTFSANGGSATGGAAEFPVIVSGGKNGDTLTGGNKADHINGDTGPDLIKGGAGGDTLNSIDGVNGNDEIQGGLGADSCTIDPGDITSSC